MSNYQFLLAFIDKLPMIVAAITSLVVLYRQGVNKKDIKATIANGQSDTQSAIQDVHAAVNVRMTELIATTKSDALQKGASDQRANDASKGN